MEKGLFGMLAIWLSSCVHTDMQCVLSICTLCSGELIKVLVLFLMM